MTTSLTIVEASSLRREVPLLLAATLEADGVRLETTRELPSGSWVEIALPDDTPGTWSISIEVINADDELLLPAVERSSRIQVRLPDERRSNIVFVTDPDAALHRPRQVATARRRIPALDEVFRDPAAAHTMFALLDDLTRAHRPGNVGGRETPSDQDRVGSPTVGDWRDYLADATEMFGPETVAFVLGVRTRSRRSVQSVLPNWDDDDPHDAPGGIDDESADESATELDGGPASTVGYWATQKKREHYWRAITGTETDDPVQMLLAIQLILQFVAAGGRARGDHGWRSELHRHLDLLGRLDVPDVFAASAASLTAVALAAARSTLPPLALGLEAIEQRRIERDVSHLLVEVDQTLIEDYAHSLIDRFGSHLDSEEVLELSARIVDGNPLNDAIADVTARGIPVEVEGSFVKLSAPAVNPLNSVLSVLSRFEEIDSVAVRADGDGTDWAVAVWERPHLMVLRPGSPPNGWGCVYDLHNMALGALTSGEIQVVSDREVELFTVKERPGPLASSLLATHRLTRAGTEGPESTVETLAPRSGEIG